MSNPGKLNERDNTHIQTDKFFFVEEKFFEPDAT
jgi:hypothetical protein